MHILIIAEKRKQVKPYLDALSEKKIKAKYLRVSKITLVSKQNKTLVKSLGEEIPIYDAVFIQARTSLAPFIEPLLEELNSTNCYTSAKKGAYYIGWNEPYQFVTLALNKIPTPKTITTASEKNIEQIARKIAYPVKVKTFLGKKVQQSLKIKNNNELNSFAKSIKTEIDAFMIKQFVEGRVITCAVVGEKVFAVKRDYNKETIAEIEKAKPHKPNEAETKIAQNAARACGFDIARVDLVKGKVIKVDPIIPIEKLTTVLSLNIAEYICEYLIEKAHEHEGKVKTTYDIFGLKRIIANTIFGRFF